MAETTNRSQTVNFLGFLRSQLSGLQGIPTLCYELIQNADDVKDGDGNPAASRISFDVCDDALIVENDGVFREIDFTRMENVSWGNKKEEAGTTGAFGIGFISVYQVTDAPEILSSGRHWKFEPGEVENKRILETPMETKYTRFRLPWAFEPSKTRLELGIPAVENAALDDYALQMADSIESAALFLKQVNRLEVKRNGKTVRTIETLKEKGSILLSDSGKVTRWCIIEGNFDINAGVMRLRYSSVIESKRQARVQLAIPETPLENGLLYAFLPSETNTGLPFHINADFYPSSDRKRILFGSDYKAEWNRYAIDCAAYTLSKHLDDVLEIFPLTIFWKFAQVVKAASANPIADRSFSKFWDELKSQICVKKTVLTAAESKKIPSDVKYLDSDDEVEAAQIFEELGLSTIHPDLRQYRNLLFDVGIKLLKPVDIGNACLEKGLNKRISFEQLPSQLSSLKKWEIFWSAINSLWQRTAILDKAASEQILAQCSIAPGFDDHFWPPRQLLSGDATTRTLFSQISKTAYWLDTQKATSPIPSTFVPTFELATGLGQLENNQGVMQEFYEIEPNIIKQIYDWLMSHESIISRQESIKDRIRQISIWPTADGSLHKLNNLFLTGDFEDPLGLANFVDVEALGGRREFIERTLKVPPLDFSTYVTDLIPLALNSQKISIEKRFHLLEVLAENVGRLLVDNKARSRLMQLPLVWCGNETFEQASKTYFDSPDILVVLGREVLIARIPGEQKEAIQDLYRWLGVSEEPRSAAIIDRIRLLTSSEPNPSNIQTIQKIFSFLATKWIYWDEAKHQEFSELKRMAWLPSESQTKMWFTPEKVFTTFRNYLFSSQGNFLRIDLQTQQKGTDFMRFLGIPGEPSVDQVVKHLLYCSEKKISANQAIYTFLSDKDNPKDPHISLLIGQPCLYIAFNNGKESYFKPDQVFWEYHPYGKFRFRLGPEFGKFKPLFDRLGVKSRPDAQDTINVLQEISESIYAISAKPIDSESDNDIEQVVIACWQLLSEFLDENQVTPEKLKTALKNKKTILNANKVLEMPERLFFEDRPGWGDNFDLVKNNLIQRINGAWPAMEASGVQRISKAITTEIHECTNTRIESELGERLSTRFSLIQRVLEMHTTKGIKGFELTALENIKFESAEKISIVRKFHGFGSDPTDNGKILETEAICLKNTLYFRKEEQEFPWLDISREITYVLYPNGDLNSLGMEIKEILSSTSEEVANRNLDRLGYPRLKIVEKPDANDGIETTPGGQPTGETGDSTGETAAGSETGSTAGTEGGNGSGTGSGNGSGGRSGGGTGTGSGTGVGKGTGTGAGSETNLPPRKTSHLISYVYSEDDLRNEKPETGENTRRKIELGNLGVARVMAYEKSKDRTPTEMPYGNPGYDIKSVDSNGSIRYIEVKALTNQWDSQSPAQLTRTEFEFGKEMKSSYWLYVVELVERDDFKIHRIQNPSNLAEYFLFDHGWLSLVQKDE